MKTSEILREACERLTPERWFQGVMLRPPGFEATRAIATSLEFNCAIMALPNNHECYRALIAANDLPRHALLVDTIVAWNNSPDTTFEDVKLGFKRAIAWAEERGE